MAGKESFNNTHERILQGALEVISEKGFSVASIRDISNRVDCNSITIFRHFEDKQTLFLRVVERFCDLDYDTDTLDRELGYTDIREDLTTIAKHFFDVLYANIHIIRIFISEAPQHGEISKYAWYLPSPMEKYVMTYLETLYPRVISPMNATLIAEMFTAYVMRACLRISVHGNTEQPGKNPANAAKDTLPLSANMIADIVDIHLQRARVGQKV